MRKSDFFPPKKKTKLNEHVYFAHYAKTSTFAQERLMYKSE